MAENFRTQILNSKDGSVSAHAPVRTLGSCTFMFLRHSDLYILMVTKNNSNTMMAFKYMTSVRHTPSACCVCSAAHMQAGKQVFCLQPGNACMRQAAGVQPSTQQVSLGSLRGSARSGSRLARSRRMHPCTRNTQHLVTTNPARHAARPSPPFPSPCRRTRSLLTCSAPTLRAR